MIPKDANDKDKDKLNYHKIISMDNHIIQDVLLENQNQNIILVLLLPPHHLKTDHLRCSLRTKPMEELI